MNTFFSYIYYRIYSFYKRFSVFAVYPNTSAASALAFLQYANFVTVISVVAHVFGLNKDFLFSIWFVIVCILGFFYLNLQLYGKKLKTLHDKWSREQTATKYMPAFLIVLYIIVSVIMLVFANYI